MRKKNLFWIILIVFIATVNIFAQTQDGPIKEDLERRIIKRIYTDVSDSKKWEIKVEYPELRLDGDKPAVGFSGIAKSMAMKQVEDFKQTMSEFTDEDREFLPAGANYEMAVSYQVEYLDDNFISINFGRYEYTGGAHPNHWSFTLNYDLKEEKVLELSDLLNQNTDYLKVISQNSISQITKKQGEYADADWIKSGAGEDITNFQSWNITKKGLKFTFDPYLVGPYAAGDFETLVPFEKFSVEIQSPVFNRLASISLIDGNPPNVCRNGLFTNQNVDFKLSRVKGRKNQRTYFYSDEGDCPNSTSCRRNAYLIAGDQVIIAKTYNDYVCAWYQPQRGSETVGWLPVSSLTAQAPAKPGNVNWAGKWFFGSNNIEINATRSRGKYRVKGIAFWQGLGDNIHTGEIDYEGLPVKDKMNLASGEDQYDCRVKMQQLGQYLIVSDNLMCGGMNVSFNGVYQRK